MRQLLFLAAVFFVTAAVADDKLDTKELDKSSTNMSTTTTATDYNSSRSNNINAAVPAGGPIGDENDDDEQSETRAQDYNSSRSNTTSAIDDKVDLDKDSVIHRDIATRNMQTHDDDDDDKAAAEYQDPDDPVTRKRPGKR
ncbi:MAG: hypothetical protein QNI98_04485 [Woeseiaceae bacterium]|nr:hypothetical protein [Woeseiaceae bacterium]